MKKQMLIAASLAILLLSALAGIHLGGSVFAQSVEAVTIKADGTVEPTTAPIIKVGDIYTLTDNINGSLTVEREDCTVNGAGHQVRRLTLNLVDNVTAVYFNVKNTKSDGNKTGDGVVIYGATNSVIAYNNVSGYDIGICAAGPSWDPINYRALGLRNVIAGNKVTDNNSHGIYVNYETTTVVGNYIESNGNGIYLFLTRNNTIMGNAILNNSVGLRIMFYMETSYFHLIGLPENIICNNSFENAQNVINEGWGISPLAHSWADGGVGNYWSDYTGTDDGDGTGDDPYVIDSLNQDNFPLVAPITIPAAPVELPELPAAPSVVLLNPANATYNNASVPLGFVVDERGVWLGYSLDENDNVTVAGNVTLSGLSDGTHTLTVYAKDTFGFTGASETVTFIIATFPTTSIILIVISTVAVVACLLIYLKKRKR